MNSIKEGHAKKKSYKLVEEMHRYMYIVRFERMTHCRRREQEKERGRKRETGTIHVEVIMRTAKSRVNSHRSTNLTRVISLLAYANCIIYIYNTTAALIVCFFVFFLFSTWIASTGWQWWWTQCWSTSFYPLPPPLVFLIFKPYSFWNPTICSYSLCPPPSLL